MTKRIETRGGTLRRRSRSPRWSPAQARRVLADLIKSGLPVTRFAAERGVTAARLYHWKQRLRDREPTTSSPGFTEVKLVAPVPAGAVIELLLPGGVQLRCRGATRLEDAVALLSRLPGR